MEWRSGASQLMASKRTHIDPSALQPRHLLAHKQPQPTASDGSMDLGVPLLEPLEQMALVLERHPSSGIFDLDVDVAVVSAVDELLGDRRVEMGRVEDGRGFEGGRTDEGDVDGDFDELLFGGLGCGRRGKDTRGSD